VARASIAEWYIALQEPIRLRDRVFAIS
jgi:hypothetical protein